MLNLIEYLPQPAQLVVTVVVTVYLVGAVVILVPVLLSSIRKG